MKTPGTGIRLRWRELGFSRAIVLATSLEALRNYYGLDIRKIPHTQGGAKRGSNSAVYVVVGEWFGSKYVDYIAQRVKKEGLV